VLSKDRHHGHADRPSVTGAGVAQRRHHQFLGVRRGLGLGAVARSPRPPRSRSPQATASWGTVIAFALYDASSGNLLLWDYLGNFAWLPATVSSACAWRASR
jgi:hypothetical protein